MNTLATYQPKRNRSTVGYAESLEYAYWNATVVTQLIDVKYCNTLSENNAARVNNNHRKIYIRQAENDSWHRYLCPHHTANGKQTLQTAHKYERSSDN